MNMNKPIEQVKGPKSEHRRRVRKAMEAGDYEETLRLLEESEGPRKSIWTVTEMRDVVLKKHQAFVDRQLLSQRNPRKSPILWHLLSQELCFRAMFSDFNKYLSVIQKYPIKNLMEAFEEIKKEAGEEGISFQKDRHKAKHVLLCLHESYEKIVDILARLAAVVAKDSRWSTDLPDKYLENVLDGRYSPLVPDRKEKFIRNAFTHSDATVTRSNKFILEDIKGNKRQFGSELLDKEVKMTSLRLGLVIEGMTLPTSVTYEIARVIMILEKKRKD